MGDSKNRTVFSFSDVPAARSKIEFNVLNPHLIVLAGLRLIFNRDGKRMPKARDEVVTTSHSSMHNASTTTKEIEVPSHSDDHNGGIAWRRATDARHRSRIGDSPAAWLHDRRWFDSLQASDAVHDAYRLDLS